MNLDMLRNGSALSSPLQKEEPMTAKRLAWDTPWGEPAHEILGRMRKEEAPKKASLPSFTDKTIIDLRESFGKLNHKPSPQMWSAIKDIARTIEEIVAERDNPTSTFYVSALDPGVGKTQTIVHAVRNLPKDVGVLICLSRINEVNTLRNEMRLDRNEFAVIVGENNQDRIDDYGNENPDKARVLFTTQQKVDALLKHVNAFADLKELHFEGKPRAVRIWDESLLPGKEITLNIHKIAGCQNIVAEECAALATTISDMHAAIREIEDGSIYYVPNLSKHSNAFKRLKIRTGSNAKEGLDYDTVEALQSLSDKAVRVRRDHKGNTILDYTESLPDDFAPVLILDASARVRKTYELWRAKRGNLLHLQDAAKHYRDLTIHHWNRGGGKWAFKDDDTRAELVEGVVSAINSKPDEEWLVIVHKKDANRDISEYVREQVANKEQKIHFLTWGNAHATNQYVNVKNVILAGTLFYPESTYEVRARAAGKLKTDDPLPRDELKAVKSGEHSHLILQALCRGAVRRCIGDSCAPMDAYIIAHNASGIPCSLPDIFPKCVTKAWEPVAKPLQGKAAEAVAYLSYRWTDQPDAPISFSDVMKHLRMSNLANFKKVVRDNNGFKTALNALEGYEVELGSRKRYKTHFERSKFAKPLS